MDAPRILVVDDEETIRHVLTRLLERRGCSVVDAGSAEAALERLQFENPDVAMLDIVLPGMNGLRLAKEIRTRRPDCEIIIMTSRSSVDTAVEAIRQGAFDYISKPFESLDDVWALISRAVEKREKGLEERALLEQRQRLNDEMATALSRLSNLVEERVIRAADEPGDAPSNAPSDPARGTKTPA